MPEFLTAYGAHLPVGRLRREAIGAATRTVAGRGTRSVANYDEDSLTLAVAAGRRLDLADASRLYLATTSAPFVDKSNASLVHAALLAPPEMLSLDIGGLRGGWAAFDVAANTGGVAIASDVRTGRPGSSAERDGGDAAAAFRFGGPGEPIAEVVASASISLELMDTWRTAVGAPARTWEERFSASVYEPALRDIGTDVLKEAGLDQPSTILVATPDGRVARRVADAIGSEYGLDQLLAHRGEIGYCGSADAPVQLARALDHSGEGETILVLSGSGGADALLLRVLRDGPGTPMMPDTVDVEYADYLFWRGLLEREPARRPAPPDVSAPANHREVRWKYGLEGARCRGCGKVYLPPQRVCGGCGALDDLEPYPVADLRGTVAAFSTDGVSESPDPPGMAALIDFSDGGRLSCELTEARDGAEVGTEVEMTFRRTFTTNGTPNYFWKARPITEVAR